MGIEMSLKFPWRSKRPRIVNTLWKRAKLEECFYLTSRATLKLQSSRQCGVGEEERSV